MATHLPVIGGHAEGFGKTYRSDNWWAGPGITFLVFTSFVLYTTWALWQAKHYYAAPYLSPMYEPISVKSTPSADMRTYMKTGIVFTVWL